jgi:hypothetical protein
MLPPKHRLTLKELQGVLSQKMVLFITAAERTANPVRATVPEDVACLEIMRRFRLTVFTVCYRSSLSVIVKLSLCLTN